MPETKFQVKTSQGWHKRVLYTCGTREMAETMAAGAGMPTKIESVAR